MKWIKAILSSVLTIGLIFFFNTKLGILPPLGKLLNPFHGFWANAEPTKTESEKSFSLTGLQDKVTIQFDDNHVPHIFANNTYDLFYAQGYVTAYDRLWQMELQTHAAAGRLSEIIGDRTLELDRNTRRRGMVVAAKTTLTQMMSDSVSKQILEAYSAGVNAYISSLSPKDYPIEYKILDYSPEPWEPLKSALLLKQMATTLATGDDDGQMTNVLAHYGYDVVKDLFPDYPFHENPVIPVGTKWNFEPLPTPPQPKDFIKPISNAITSLSKFSRANSSLVYNDPQAEKEVGSNNWAINGQKSATGYPILSNDPHLELSLPSIWYQIQLVGPDVNVCGASLPGAPNVISGFNEKVAWGVTNVGSDVMDWYKITFKDQTHKEYLYDGIYKPVKQVIEVIKVRGKPDVIDTVLYTHHGPIVYNEGMQSLNGRTPIGCAMRWIAHEPSNELVTFYYLNRAKNYSDYVKALSYYISPAQNFVFASAENDIALWPNGKFPIKWKEQGKFILDGSNSAYDWQGWIPHAQNPHVLNPPRGFVSSANQFSADTTYPYYLGWEFSNYSRGERINQRLTSMQQITPDSLRMLQNDNYNIHARDVLPQLLSYVSQNQLNKEQLKAYQTVAGWNKQNNPAEIGPTIFYVWWQYFSLKLWDEFRSTEDKPMRMPNQDRTVKLVTTEPTSPWIDNKETEQKETLADIATQSFRATIDTLTTKKGELNPESWAWAKYKSTTILHLSRSILPFSRKDIWIGGGRGIVNATSERNGPSWRMVVALGPNLKAYALYPGGQSGNPGSYYYDNMIDKWSKGELLDVVFLHKQTEKNERIKATWTLTH
ncbi:penicillin acylase family protein [Cytophagaceae bacterium YF14B1]|uniref:Penicillin acylase family protein n=1 Tax=Xanthocytophaga flava TaxID=3048013 RepID=A0AAE3QSE0_9BACT|nr:penicillin acylase family protein [Xanthocytophaga flavus]MDJ1484557.1 penicillin acylase family protein [Xanthocytophaga flavus]